MSSLNTMVNLIKFKVDARQMKQEIREGEDRLKTFRTTALSIMSPLKDMRTALGALGFGAAAFGMFRMVEGAAAVADESTRMSKNLGITAAEFQKLHMSALRFHLDTTDLVDGMLQLQQSAYDASYGAKEYQRRFKDLGVEAYTAPGKVLPKLELMYKVVDGAIGKFGSISEAMPTLLNLFGEDSARKMAAFFSLGSAGMKSFVEEIGRFTQTEEEIKAGTRLRGEMYRLTGAWGALRNRVAGKLFGPLTDGANLLVDVMLRAIPVAEDLAEWLGENVRGAVDRLRLAFKSFNEDSHSFPALLTSMGVAVGAMGFTGGVMKAIPVVNNFRNALRIANVGAGGLANTMVGPLTAAEYSAAAGMAAWMTTALPVIAVIAAIAAVAAGLYLIFDDLRVYFQGGDSFIGAFLSHFPAMKQAFDDFAIMARLVFEEIKAGAFFVAKLVGEFARTEAGATTLKVIFGVLAAAMLLPFTALGAILIVIAGVIYAIVKLGEWIKKAANWFDGLGEQWNKAAGDSDAMVRDMYDKNKAKKDKNGQNFVDDSRAQYSMKLDAAAKTGSAVNNRVVNNSMSVAKIEVNVPAAPGMTSEQLQALTSQGVQDGLRQGMRDAQYYTRGGVQ